MFKRVTFVLVLMIGVHHGVHAQDDTIDGNLTVKGSVKLRKSDNTGTAGFDLSGTGTYIHLTGDGLISKSNNQQDLGISSWRFRNLWLGNNAYIDGKVGIGTTSPSYGLDVHGTTNGIIRAYGSNIGRLSLQNSSKHYSTSVQGTKWLFYDESAGATRMMVNTNGNFGIGSYEPQFKLDVDGNFQRGSGIQHTMRLTNRNALDAGDGTSLLFTNRGYGSNDYGGYIALVSTGSNPGWLNPRLDFAVQNNGTNQLSDVSTKMSILGNGNLGIGTITPVAKLEINDDDPTGRGLIVTGGGSGEAIAEFVRDIGATGSSVKVHANSNDPTLTFTSHVTSIFSVGVDLGTFKISDNATLGTNDRFSIDSGGNIGVGTANPQTKLSIQQSIDGNNAGMSIIDTQGRKMQLYGEGASGRQVIRTSGTSNPLVFDLNEIERLRINANGNIGIGTTNPNGWKLAVNGNIRAKEIKVETGWSDFVFENDYDLPTLDEVEQHIKAKGHLKDIPSAKDVAENGILLGEMDSKLLQKIEELTLYTIDQEKRIDNLEAMNKKLLKLLEKLADKKGEE